MNPPSPHPTPTIPVPTVIVRDVALVGAILSGASAFSGDFRVIAGVTGGSLGATLIMGSMAWAISAGDPARIAVRLVLQWGAALGIFWFLLSLLPAGPMMIGFCSLVLGVAVRALLGWWQGRVSEVL